MIKNQYILELKTDNKFIKKGQNNSHDVKKVQEWINLWKYFDSNWKVTTMIDGDFGPDTLEVVTEFQKHNQLQEDGIVGNQTWGKLTEPMRNAFTRINDSTDFAELIIRYAEQHVKACARELRQNEGTWVRAYMDGHEGRNFPWCVGFVQTIIDQATFTLHKTLTDFMPSTYSCDVLGDYGLSEKRLIRNSTLRKSPDKIKPGDVFLLVKTERDWIHTGIITEREGNWIHTIEGNTNDEGSREGIEVCRRKRNFTSRNIDLYKMIE